MPIAMDGTIPRFNRVVCGYFTLGGQPFSMAQQESADHLDALGKIGVISSVASGTCRYPANLR
jgi:hypothetical protein